MIDARRPLVPGRGGQAHRRGGLRRLPGRPGRREARPLPLGSRRRSARGSSTATTSCPVARPGGRARRAARPWRWRARRRDRSRPVPLAVVRLLAPVGVPPSIRDFYAFEDHVATARKSRGPRDGARTGTSCPSSTSPTRRRSSVPATTSQAPAGSEELDYELEVAAVIGVECADVDPAGWPDVVAGLHRHERLVGPRPAAPGDAPGPRPGQGQGLRHVARPVPRHARRAARRATAARVPRWWPGSTARSGAAASWPTCTSPGAS